MAAYNSSLLEACLAGARGAAAAAGASSGMSIGSEGMSIGAIGAEADGEVQLVPLPPPPPPLLPRPPPPRPSAFAGAAGDRAPCVCSPVADVIITEPGSFMMREPNLPPAGRRVGGLVNADS